jgi:hypothetical protein
MHDHGDRGGPARLPRRRRWRPSLAALVAVLALTLAVAACGGDDKPSEVASLGDSDKATSTTSPGNSGKDFKQMALAYARCVRQHGINIPDPKPGEGIGVDGSKGVNPEDPKFKAADQACQQYAPGGGGGRVDSGPQGPGGGR